jgi:hypothetical protein
VSKFKLSVNYLNLQKLWINLSNKEGSDFATTVVSSFTGKEVVEVIS